MSSLDARDLLSTKNRFFRLRVRRGVGFGERLQYQGRMSSRMDYTILDDCSNKKYIHAKESSKRSNDRGWDDVSCLAKKETDGHRLRLMIQGKE